MLTGQFNTEGCGFATATFTKSDIALLFTSWFFMYNKKLWGLKDNVERKTKRCRELRKIANNSTEKEETAFCLIHFLSLKALHLYAYKIYSPISSKSYCD